MLDRLTDGQPDWVVVVIGIALVAAIAYIVGELAARLARLVLLNILSGDDSVQVRSPLVRPPMRIIRAGVGLLTAAALIVPALDVAGFDLTIGLAPAALSRWLLGSGLRIVLIGIVGYILVWFVAAAVKRLEERAGDEAGVDVVERMKRLRTLGRILRDAVTVVVVAIGGLMILRELQVDIMPILTGAGIVGLAVGFGAQTLVRDVIAGFFLILENQVRVGDVATINDTGGLVEAINLRTIVLRDLEGVVHIFPNGAIERLANRTKDFSYYVVDVGVAYKEDTDEVVAVLQEVGAELADDPGYRWSILEPLEVLGVDGFGDSQVTIKIRIKTVPLKQWEVGRELRRRIKKAFDARRIEIPFPHMSVYFGEASRPFVWQQSA